MTKLQIGIMGSAADLKYSNEALSFAQRLGRLIAESNNILVYGAEKDYTSLSTEAAKVASSYGGITVGVAGGKTGIIYGNYKPTILINSGLEVGGGREFTLVSSCDVIIVIAGGSGTLNEICVAYQAGIPIISIDRFSGWARKLTNRYLDTRKRIKCLKASSEEEALKIAIKEGEKKYENSKC